MGWLEAIPIVGQALQAGVDYSIAKKNLTFQQQNLDYQKAMQREAWMREDTASQRKMADLKAAGLNPLLAYGMQAQSSGPIRTEAPQMEQIQPAVKMAQGVQNALNLMQQKANIEKTYAEKAAIDMQMRKTAVEAETMESLKDRNIAYQGNKLERDRQAYNELKRIEIDTAQNKAYLAKYQADIAQYSKEIKAKLFDLGIEVDQAEAELRAKQVLIAQRNHDYKIYEFLGQPSNQAWGQNLGNLVKSTAGLVGDVWNDLKSRIKGE